MQELAWDRRRHLPLNLELRKVCNRINCDFTSVKKSLCADSTLDRTNFLLSFDNNNNEFAECNVRSIVHGFGFGVIELTTSKVFMF